MEMRKVKKMSKKKKIEKLVVYVMSESDEVYVMTPKQEKKFEKMIEEFAWKVDEDYERMEFNDFVRIRNRMHIG